MWVKGGCGGRFRILTGLPQGAQGQEGGSDNTGAWIAGAAVAAIAGAAILANKRDKDRERDRDDQWNDDRYPGQQPGYPRSEEHTSELQSHSDLVCRLLLEKKTRHRQDDCYSAALRRRPL